MWRLNAPALRCELLTVNIDKQDFVDSNEPYNTLCEERTAPDGLACLFGTYYSCDLLETRQEYNKALP